MPITDLVFISEDEYFFTATYDPMMERLSCEDEEKTAKALKDESDYIVFDEIPFWHNGRGVTNKKRNRLYHYRAGEVTAVTDPFTDVLSFKLDEGSKHLIFIARRFTDKMDTSNRLFLLRENETPVDISFEKEDFDHQHVMFVAPDTILLEGPTGRNTDSIRTATSSSITMSPEKRSSSTTATTSTAATRWAAT